MSENIHKIKIESAGNAVSVLIDGVEWADRLEGIDIHMRAQRPTKMVLHCFLLGDEAFAVEADVAEVTSEAEKNE